ncbi:MAG: indole-3-glycerol phosphate synthase TrpC [Oscillospiraceae bacterium]|nr:indole-3-glycerol phosphate synthase TrpC [Oscillospiraceae bacterium]
MDILHEITKRTIERIETRKKALPFDRLVEMAYTGGVSDSFPFEKALRSTDIAFICEIKKASPSKGIITDDFPYRAIAKEYEAAGAAAISVLTEPYWFKGDDRYLREIADTASIPLLRKDFAVDSYMIYEAKVLGASAVLLICSILDQKTLAEYISITNSLGLSALVEVHDEDETKMALRAGARIIGVNNRNLKTFEVDTGNSIRLRSLAPKEIVFVSESGIRTAQDINMLRQHNINAVLIGETLMRSPNKKAALAELRADINGHGKNANRTTSARMI